MEGLTIRYKVVVVYHTYYSQLSLTESARYHSLAHLLTIYSNMSTDKYLLIVAYVLVAAAAYVLARPQKEFILSDVANKTMCPIEVEINDNPERIPRRIKYLKCAARPNKLCSQHHISHGCCRQHHHAFVTECVEIYDWVQVTFKGQDAPQAIKVPVGCTCLIEETTAAAEVP